MALIIIYIVRKTTFIRLYILNSSVYVDENFNQEIKCCMSLVIENAAFYDPDEPEVENFQVSKNICRSRLRNGSVNEFLSESRSANIFLGLENFLRSVRGS